MNRFNANCYNLREPGGDEYIEQCADIQQNEIVYDQSQLFQNEQYEPSPQQSNVNPLPSIESLGFSPFNYSRNSNPQDDHYFLNPSIEEMPRPPLPHTIYQPSQHASIYVPNIYVPQETQKYSQELHHLHQSNIEHPNFAPSQFPNCEMQPQAMPQDSLLQQRFISHRSNEATNEMLNSESWPACQYSEKFTQQPLPQTHHNHCGSKPNPLVQPSKNMPSSLDPKMICRSKTKRIRFTSFQNLELKKEFDCNYYPSSSRQIEIAKALGVTTKQIQIWFQNRRKICKKNNSNSETNSVIYPTSLIHTSEETPQQSPIQNFQNMGFDSPDQQVQPPKNTHSSGMKTLLKWKFHSCYQIQELEKEFLINSYPTRQQKIKMAEYLSMTEKQIVHWFENRRAKLKKMHKLKVALSMNPTFPSEGAPKQPPSHHQNRVDSSSKSTS